VDSQALASEMLYGRKDRDLPLCQRPRRRGIRAPHHVRRDRDNRPVIELWPFRLAASSLSRKIFCTIQGAQRRGNNARSEIRKEFGAETAFWELPKAETTTSHGTLVVTLNGTEYLAGYTSRDKSVISISALGSE